jgi:hypothetical protein
MTVAKVFAAVVLALKVRWVVRAFVLIVTLIAAAVAAVLGNPEPLDRWDWDL